MPARVESDSGCVVEDDIVGAGVEVAQPPGLVRRSLLNQVAQYGLLVPGRADAVIVGLPEGRIGRENWWDRRSDGLVNRRAVRDPADLCTGPEPPALPVLAISITSLNPLRGRAAPRSDLPARPGTNIRPWPHTARVRIAVGDAFRASARVALAPTASMTSVAFAPSASMIDSSSGLADGSMTAAPSSAHRARRVGLRSETATLVAPSRRALCAE